MEKPVQILLVFLAFHLLGAASNEGELDDRLVEYRLRRQQFSRCRRLNFMGNRHQLHQSRLQHAGYNYIVRAGFYYGNYDGLSKPPTFDLKLDRENWTTVNTSSSVDGGLPIYHEAIYLTRSGNLTVCLVQTRDGEVPFISSLEGVPITNLYEEVLDTTTATLHLVARTNFGGSEVIKFPDDSYNRVWTRGAIPPNCHANVSIPIGYSIDIENAPPISMLLNYIESVNVSYPITLDVNLPLQYSTPLPAYFVFYFADLASTRVQGWWSIDCGSSSSHVVDGSISWEIDTNYTKADSNRRVPQNQAVEEMNTLRFFPNQTDNNCYVIPLKFPGFNHIVRAGFYYGNYDGLSKPPTFDLKLDRENWTTVNTSSSVDGGLPIYHEAIYLTRSGNLTVCLVQTMDREVPFISSLEGVPIRNIYEEVLDTTTATLHLVASTNFGGSEVR
ncbi:hypothetical protein VitviT2T_019140 [Vitis vinifera]|uniref:Malectin-like domain-containing protein n=1 Tax=Vitis vinifera TaxID=29760 RepID=A0ABY9CZN0_VITVI|nr:hypothetical protein VitviT2T_019140 [Vitis vinifera]